MTDIKLMIMDLLNKQEYDFYDLCDVVRVLRSDVGCPWDKEQNHKSIRNDIIEETYEVVEAIDSDDIALLREELGDVMLQVVFHSVIEEENENFDVDCVTTDICKKLIHRHPHVFGDVTVENTAQVLANWDKIKSDEKSRNTVYSSMQSIPPMLPALMRARKIGSRAAKVGFDFSDVHEAFSKIREETLELEQSLGTEASFDELGDLLFSVVNVARFLNINPEEALNHSNKKFMERFGRLEKAVRDDGKEISELSMDVLDEYYNRAKNDIIEKKY